MLEPTLQLLALVSNECAILCFQRSCFDARGDGEYFDPLIDPLSVAAVG